MQSSGVEVLAVLDVELEVETVVDELWNVVMPVLDCEDIVELL